MTAARTDSIQRDIVKAWRQHGASVLLTHTVGKGCPDAIVYYNGVNYLVEIKAPKGRLTPAQVKFHEAWKGTIYIVRSVDDALRLIGVET